MNRYRIPMTHWHTWPLWMQNAIGVLHIRPGAERVEFPRERLEAIGLAEVQALASKVLAYDDSESAR